MLKKTPTTQTNIDLPVKYFFKKLYLKKYFLKFTELQYYQLHL